MPVVRYHAFDALRASMMLLGIVLHASAPYVGGAAWFVQDPPRSVPLAVTVVLIHVFRMPVFFVMSGFFGALLFERFGPSRFLQHRAKRIVVPFVVGWMVLAPLTVGIMGYVLAAHPSAMPPGVPTGQPSLNDLLNPLHLWFLEYLALFSVVTVGIRRVMPAEGRGAMARWSNWLLGRGTASLGGLLGLSVVTAVVYGLARTIALPAPNRMIPDPKAFIVYGLYFGFGWWLHGNTACLAAFRRFAGRALWLAGAAAVLYIVLLDAVARTNGARPGLNFAAILANTSMAWCSIAGLTGMFLRCADAPSRTWRYLSDSSYWLYLVHPPILVALQGWLVGADWPPLVKAAVVTLAATPALLLSYEFGVRYTWVGTWLNGKRNRPAVVAPLPVE